MPGTILKKSEKRIHDKIEEYGDMEGEWTPSHVSVNQVCKWLNEFHFGTTDPPLVSDGLGLEAYYFTDEAHGNAMIRVEDRFVNSADIEEIRTGRQPAQRKKTKRQLESEEQIAARSRKTPALTADEPASGTRIRKKSLRQREADETTEPPPTRIVTDETHIAALKARMTR